jgi:hypothetical protein
MVSVSISIVNLNCLEHTKNLIFDLDRQTFIDYSVTVYDQNSLEKGTTEFLNLLEQRNNYSVIRNKENVPLNYIWNEFSENNNSEFICLLNNDIRITSNYLMDSVTVLNKDSRIGIACHATNNRRYTTATSPTRHIFENNNIKQGWEFMFRKSDWVPIPNVLRFYCGDDFIFDTMHNKGKKVAIITSSPVIHKLSKTREAMGDRFISETKKIALEDIENYKKLGYKHQWNNISKQCRLSPEIKQLVEISSEINLCKFTEYHKRLKEHLKDSNAIDGHILDIGINDYHTFDTLLSNAIDTNKKLIAVTDALFKNDGEIINNSFNSEILNKIKNNSHCIDNSSYFEIKNSSFTESISSINTKISFAFLGCFNANKIKILLPILWDKMANGGTIFIPYYNFDTGIEIKNVIDNYFNNKKLSILKSRIQERKGVKDTYLAIKCLKPSVPFIHRKTDLYIASVLKLGGIYDETYVNKLASTIKRHVTKKYKFVCLTDSKDIDLIDKKLVDHIIPLEFNFKGWWSKMELFRPELFSESQVLYFDLDTLIVKNIDEVTSYGGDFLTLRDFNTLVNVSSGILGWKANKQNIFYKFIRSLLSSEIILDQFYGGDQQAIEFLYDGKIDWFQDLFPNIMAPFKYECYNSETTKISLPEKASVICFHSKPKMNELKNHPIIIQHWR